jgi:hypothetical protein
MSSAFRREAVSSHALLFFFTLCCVKLVETSMPALSYSTNELGDVFSVPLPVTSHSRLKMAVLCRVTGGIGSCSSVPGSSSPAAAAAAAHGAVLSPPAGTLYSAGG